MRIVFMGTPDFAAESLQAVLDWDDCEVVGVYTQPDRPCGRGQKCKMSPVKELALKHSIDVYQPVNFKDQADVDTLSGLEPDVLVVAAYGLILPQSVLDIPKLMPVNVHASLLPKFRGASPIQASILNGDEITGVTIMKMEAGLDTGPMLLQRSLRIGYDEDAGQLHDQLAGLGGRLLVEALERMTTGRLVLIDQDPEKATYAPKLVKEDGRVDFSKAASEVHNLVRGVHPWPGAFFDWQAQDGKTIRLKLAPGTIGRALENGEKPGRLIGEVEGRLAIACADNVYLTPEIKPEGRKAMDAKAFCCGYMNRCG